MAQDYTKPSEPTANSVELQIRNLSVAEVTPFSTGAPTAVSPEIKCDSKGNIFLLETTSAPVLLLSGAISSIPVFKLSVDSKSTTTYPVPMISGYRDLTRSHFNIGPDGGFYMLLSGRDTWSKSSVSFLIVKCDDNGNVDSYFKFGGVPTGRFQPARFAVFSDGRVLATGTLSRDGEDSDSVTAMFDRAGRFVTYVRLSNGPELTPTAGGGAGVKATKRAGSGAAAQDGKLEEKQDPMILSGVLAISAPDGYVYLLRGGTRPRLYAISSAGEAIRDFAVAVPAPGLTATNMSLTGDNAILISFGVVHGAGGAAESADPNGPQGLIGVVSPLTGVVSAVYRLPTDADQFSMAACAPSSNRFRFVGTTPDGQHQQVTQYTSR